MNGAESLLATLVNNGVEVCFTNPGTSEMHFVAALDEVEGMRCVLCLFEGVLSGAADGYARMARKPASTLLHLGPGLGNALANIHNAKKGYQPMVNIIGDHATYHLEYDAPLTSDIEGIAGPVSHWVYSSKSSHDIGVDAAEACRQANLGQIATLILPADVSWGDNPNGAVAAVEATAPARVSQDRIDQAIAKLKSSRSCMVMIGGREIDAERGLMLSRIGKVSGARASTDTFPTRVARGAGTAAIERLPYLAELAIDHIKDIEHLILIGAKVPVSFFAYPNVPSAIAAEGCEQFVLATPEEDIDQALSALLEGLEGQEVEPEIHPLNIPELPSGALDATSAAVSLTALMPEDTIVVDEGITSGLACFPTTSRLVESDRWRYRVGSSCRSRCRHCLPGAQGFVPGRGWQCDVYHPVPVDHGSGKPGCHRGYLQQPKIQYSGTRVFSHRRPRGDTGPQGRQHT